MNNLEAIKERIAKLKKHAESASTLGSKEEAATFAAKVTELLLEYNLLDSDINMNNENKFKSWIYSEKLSYKCNQSGDRARLKLVRILCKYNLCDYVWESFSKTFEIYGKMENVDQVVWLYNYLSIGLLRLAQQAHIEALKTKSLDINRYSFLKNFMFGAATGIDSQLQKTVIINFNHSNVNALIKVNEKDLEEFLEKSPVKVKTVKMKTIIVGHGYEEGIKVGESYSINKPLDKNTDYKILQCI